jgi:hypothetical protein
MNAGDKYPNEPAIKQEPLLAISIDAWTGWTARANNLLDLAQALAVDNARRLEDVRWIKYLIRRFLDGDRSQGLYEAVIYYGCETVAATAIYPPAPTK